MKNLLKNKCPACNSTNLKNPGGFIPNLYAVDPIECNDCKASFEPHIFNRLGLWFFVSAIFLLTFFKDTLLTYFTKSSLGMFTVVIIGLFFALIIIGATLQIHKPWQYTITKGNTIKTKIINYAAILSISAYIVIYYVTKE